MRVGSEQTLDPGVAGTSGNPAGRPKGSRNRTTLAVQEILDGEAEALTRKVIKLALAGDMVALRLCLERIAPARRDRTIRCELPEVASAADAVQASAALIAAVAAGDLTPSEAESLGRLLDAHVRALAANDFEERLVRLEQDKRR